MTTSIVFVDQGPATDGSALAEDTLDTAVVAQGYLIAGGVVGPSSTGSSVPPIGIALMMPETTAVVVVPNEDVDLPPATVFVRVPIRAVTCQFNADNYIDLYASIDGAVSTGTYTVTQVATGGPAPTPIGSPLRLCVVTLDGTHVLSGVQLATPCPVNQRMVQADTTEAQVFEPFTPLSTLVENMDRLRWQLGAIYARVPGGGEWTSTGTTESWQTSQPYPGSGGSTLQPMVPWSTRGIANGVAELDGDARLPVGELPFHAVFTQPSFFSDGSFLDPYGSLELAVKVSQGLGVDVLYARLAYIDQLYATDIGSEPDPVINLWVTNIYCTNIFPDQVGSEDDPVTDLWVINLHIPIGGSIDSHGPITAPEVHTPSLWVDDIYQYTSGHTFIDVHTGLKVEDFVSTPHLYVDGMEPYTSGGGVINVTHATFNVAGQVQGTSLYTGGVATVGSLGVTTTATVGTTLGVGGAAVFGSFGSGPGMTLYGPETLRDTSDPDNPTSLTIGYGRSISDDGGHTFFNYNPLALGFHADLMVAENVAIGNINPLDSSAPSPCGLAVHNNIWAHSDIVCDGTAWLQNVSIALAVTSNLECSADLIVDGVAQVAQSIATGGADPLGSGAPADCELAIKQNAWFQARINCDDTILTEYLHINQTVTSNVHSTGTLEADGEVQAGTAVRLRRLIYDRGPAITGYANASVLGNSVEGAAWATQFDNYGAVLFHTGSGSQAAGPQFSVYWGGGGGDHARLPGIFVGFAGTIDISGVGAESHDYELPTGSAYLSSIVGPDTTTGGGVFTVGFTFTPVQNTTYCLFYHVIESPHP